MKSTSGTGTPKSPAVGGGVGVKKGGKGVVGTVGKGGVGVKGKVEVKAAGGVVNEVEVEKTETSTVISEEVNLERELEKMGQEEDLLGSMDEVGEEKVEIGNSEDLIEENQDSLI